MKFYQRLGDESKPMNGMYADRYYVMHGNNDVMKRRKVNLIKSTNASKISIIEKRTFAPFASLPRRKRDVRGTRRTKKK